MGIKTYGQLGNLLPTWLSCMVSQRFDSRPQIYSLITSFDESLFPSYIHLPSLHHTFPYFHPLVRFSLTRRLAAAIDCASRFVLT